MLGLERSYVENVDLERVSPEPEKVEIHGDEFRYIFAVTQVAQPLHVVFHIKPDNRGRLTGRMRASSGEALAISQFVFP